MDVVPDGALTDLLDQSAPPAEAVQTPQGNELDEEGPTDHVPRKQIRVKAKTEGLDNPDEAVFTIREEKDHESWRQLHRRQELERQHEHLHFAKRGVYQESMVSRLSPFLCLRTMCFHANMDATAFANTALRRKTTETSHCKMTEEEAAEMDEAKSCDLAAWMVSMRWVLTWKPPDEQGRKARARIVVLGFQHPEVTELQVASPTLSRLGRILTLQWASFNHAELECADAKSAFLQGDGEEMQETEDVYARALGEIACAMNTPLGSAVKLPKAFCRLGHAPRSWWFSVEKF